MNIDRFDHIFFDLVISFLINQWILFIFIFFYFYSDWFHFKLIMVTNCNDVMATANEIRWNCNLRRRICDSHTELNEPFQIVSINGFRTKWYPTFEWQNPSWGVKISNEHAIKGKKYSSQIHLLIDENKFDKFPSKIATFLFCIPVNMK